MRVKDSHGGRSAWAWHGKKGLKWPSCKIEKIKLAFVSQDKPSETVPALTEVREPYCWPSVLYRSLSFTVGWMWFGKSQSLTSEIPRSKIRAWSSTKRVIKRSMPHVRQLRYMEPNSYRWLMTSCREQSLNSGMIMLHIVQSLTVGDVKYVEAKTVPSVDT